MEMQLFQLFGKHGVGSGERDVAVGGGGVAMYLAGAFDWDGARVALAEVLGAQPISVDGVVECEGITSVLGIVENGELAVLEMHDGPVDFNFIDGIPYLTSAMCVPEPIIPSGLEFVKVGVRICRIGQTLGCMLIGREETAVLLDVYYFVCHEIESRIFVGVEYIGHVR